MNLYNHLTSDYAYIRVTLTVPTGLQANKAACYFRLLPGMWRVTCPKKEHTIKFI